MRALLCRNWGPVDGLRIEEIAVPEPAASEVLIRVKAAGVNFADALMVAGNYQTRPPLPFSPGIECAGVVESVGDSVTQLLPGERVMSTLYAGGMAEFAIARATDCIAVPTGMDFDVAGAFPVVYLSADVAIRWEGRLEAGETLLVLGAGGGMGLAAVEIGKAMGARVIAAASNTAKLALATTHGADSCIDYTREDLLARVQELTGGRGVDVCFDPVGGALFDAALSSLAWGGRILLVGFTGGVPQIPANRLLVKNRSAHGSSLRHFRTSAPAKLARSAQELLHWYEEGRLRPHIGQRLALSEGAAAIAMLTTRQAQGKVVLLPELDRG